MIKINKTRTKKISITFILTTLFMISALYNIGIMNSNEKTNLTNNSENIINIKSAVEADEEWTGFGNNRTTRVYISNSSSAINQMDYFNVTVPYSPSKAYSAILNFSFDGQYTTNETYEQDSPIYYPREQLSSRSRTYWSTQMDNFSVLTGNILSGSENLVMNGNDDYIEISDDNNIVNVSYSANFSTVPGFNNKQTIGLKLVIDKDIVTANNVLANITVFNNRTGLWDVVITNLNWSNGRNTEIITIPNTRLSYLNDTSYGLFKINLYNETSNFKINVREIEVFALEVIEKYITNTSWPAIEFELNGNATVNGFYAWIRTLNQTTPDVNLTVSLYRANVSADRQDVISTTQKVMEPGTLISTRNITGYEGDEYTFIPFNANYSGIENLNISNYFVVLSTNTSDQQYSLVTIPYTDENIGDNNNDPDNVIDNLFLYSSDSGSNWDKVFLSGQSYQLEAAPFAVNITRNWIPEDINMKIDDLNISSVEISDGIYQNNPNWIWGLGHWEGLFNTQNESILDNISINLAWDTSITSNLNFDVDYNITIYTMENSTTFFNITYNKSPFWYLNYTLNANSYPNWELNNFSYVIPRDWYYIEVLDPNNIRINENITNTADPDNRFVWVDYNKTIQYSGYGNYSLEVTGINHIYDSESYLCYENNNDEMFYWKTNGFMIGDNISVSLSVVNFTLLSSNGTAEVQLYDTLGSKIVQSNFISQESIDGENIEYLGDTFQTRKYQFGNVSIFNTTETTEKGEYSLTYKWSNGDEVGFFRKPVYITDYTSTINEIFVDEEDRKNIILGEVNSNKTDKEIYDVGLFTINQTIEGTPFVNESLQYDLSSDTYLITVENFIMNESLFNPGEEIKINITLKNQNLYWGNNMKIGVEFLQEVNRDWIIMDKNSSTFFIEKAGRDNSEKNIQINFTVPENYKGYNAPIRKSPIVVNLKFWIDDSKQPVNIDINRYFTIVEEPESILEGNIIGNILKYNRTGKVFISEVDRDLIQLPGDTMYLIQIWDDNFVSVNQTEKEVFSTKLFSNFTNIEVSSNKIWGNNFDISGNLVDELGEKIKNKNVQINYYQGDSWKPLNDISSSNNNLLIDNNGYFKGEFNSKNFNKTQSLKIKLSFSDSNYYSEELIKTISFNTFANNVEISIVNQTDAPFYRKGELNILTLEIFNAGNSSLEDIKFNLEIPNVVITQKGFNETRLNLLKPNEKLYIEFTLSIPGTLESSESDLNITFQATTLESNETFSLEKILSLSLIEKTIFDNFLQLFIGIIILGIIGVWIGVVYYGKSVKTKDTKIIKKEEKKRGRYVKVEELKKKEKKEKESSKESERTADLDDLLDEEGIKNNESDSKSDSESNSE